MPKGLNILGADEKALIVMCLEKLERIESMVKNLNLGGGGGSTPQIINGTGSNVTNGSNNKKSGKKS